MASFDTETKTSSWEINMKNPVMTSVDLWYLSMIDCPVRPLHKLVILQLSMPDDHLALDSY